MFVFRRSRKTNHIPLPLREQSARKTSVFNQKTMFLGYAHSSTTYIARFARKKGKCSSFFGQSPKNESPLFFSASEASVAKELRIS
ncbi:MAG: hypothetical protein U5L45_04025 [Saprospiraceae bacterium]|nr:hypothetical protein [Saprospiraceae bacterium]